jgi:spore germination protein
MIIHIVKSGETLSSISQIYTIPESAIIELNSIRPPNKLVTGQALLIQISPISTDKLPSLQINGYTYSKYDKSIINKSLPYLTYLTIFGYRITSDGSVSNVDDEELIMLCKENGVAPIMFLSTINATGSFSSKSASILLNDLSIQNNLIESVINKMIIKGYRALNIDFGFIPTFYRQNYIDFIINLKNALEPLDYEVIVGIPPRTIIQQTNIIFNNQNYTRIDNIANIFSILEYEWGHTYGPPKAVCPITKLQKVTDYALTLLPPSKTSLGIQNTGNDWILPYKLYTAAKSLSNQDALDIAKRYGSIINYDTTAQAPYFTYNDNTDRTHIVWFEDVRSIEAKLNLVNEYNLGGIAIWNIERVIPQFWEILNSIFKIEKI